MHIKIINHLSEIERVHHNLKEYGRDNSLDDTLMQKMCIIIDEILTNIIKYAYQDNHEHHIHIECKIENDQLNMTFVDDGSLFNPLQYQPSDSSLSIEDRKPGGLGILLMKELTDNMMYERTDHKNVVRIIKYIQ